MPDSPAVLRADHGADGNDDVVTRKERDGMKWMGVWIGAAVLAGCATTGQTQKTEGLDTPKEQQAAAMSHYLSSVVHQKLGQAPEAIDELRRAADLAPESTRLV